MTTSSPLHAEIVTDHDPEAFDRAIEEARPVIASVFALDAGAEARLLRILSRPGLFRRVAVLYRSGDRCVGYQLITFEQITVGGQPVAVCRPLVGFAEGVRGSRRAFVDSIPIVLRVQVESQLPMYMVSVAVTPMGYRMAANATRQVFPSPVPHPSDARSSQVLAEALRRWGSTVEDRSGVLVTQNVRCQIPYRPGPGETDDISAFFLRHCPDYTEGVGMPVCTPLSLSVLAEVGLFTLRRQLRARFPLPSLSAFRPATHA